MNIGTIKLIFYLIASVSQMFIYCWISENLITEIENVANEIYDVPWYLCPVNTQKCIKLMILRSQLVLGVSAAKFYLISLKSFQTVFNFNKFSFSIS